METIKVKDLEETNTLSNTDSIPILTDDIDNYVERINAEDLANSIGEIGNFATTEQLETKQDVGDCVLKSGDTMTGRLTINADSPTPLTLSGRITKSSGTQTYQDIQALNNEGNRVGLLRFENSASDDNSVGLSVMKPGTGTSQGHFQIGCNTSGELFVNATAGIKKSILNWSFPSNRYIDLTLGASGSTYKAPANGYFYITKVAGSADKYIQFTREGEPFGIEVVSRATTTQCKCFLPVRKGDVVTCSYSVTGTTMTFRFYYAEGDS